MFAVGELEKEGPQQQGGGGRRQLGIHQRDRATTAHSTGHFVQVLAFHCAAPSSQRLALESRHSGEVPIEPVIELRD
jgi:hypothetical protein